VKLLRDFHGEIQFYKLSNVLHFLMKYTVHLYLDRNMKSVASMDQKIYSVSACIVETSY